MKKPDLDLIQKMVEDYPAHTVVRCLAETLENKADNHDYEIKRKLRQLSSQLFKVANLYRYI